MSLQPRLRPRVAFQGELGAFSDAAISRVWRGRATPVPQLDCQRVAQAVAEGRVEFGLLAVRNSIAGPVAASQAALAEFPELRVVRRTTLPIRLCLMAPPGATPKTVRRVHSHPMALAQCTGFFEGSPSLVAVAAYDTAGAARDIAARADPCEAAIAPRRAATRYGLRVLRTGIEDRSDNRTEFWVIAPPDSGQAAHRQRGPSVGESLRAAAASRGSAPPPPATGVPQL